MNQHITGPNCTRCCCGGPNACQVADCEGFIHEKVCDEVLLNDIWQWIHHYACDSCVFSETPVGYEKEEFSFIKPEEGNHGLE